jgi:hypothetical protein
MVVNADCENGCYQINLTLPNASNVSETVLGDDKMVVYPGKDNVGGCSLNIKKKIKKGKKKKS